MKKINVNGVNLAYKEFGSGNKILLSTQNFFFEDCHMELLGKPPYDYHVYLITIAATVKATIFMTANPATWSKYGARTFWLLPTLSEPISSIIQVFPTAVLLDGI